MTGCAPLSLASPTLLLLLAACAPTDGATDETDVHTEPHSSPEARLVGESSIDLGVVCAASQVEVSVANEGDAPLSLTSVALSGGDWSLVGEAPTTVSAGGQATIVVSGSDGDGTLTVQTDDPDAPSLTVELAATANTPPTVSIGEHPGVVAPGAQQDFSAQVTDDDPSSVSLVWTSSEDGELGTGDVLQWEAADRTEGTHGLTLTATDACGEVATAQTSVCQNAGYTEETLDLETWTFSGQASWDAENGWVELTDTRRYITGSAFQTSQAVDSTNVSIRFSFYASGGSGADGLSITAIDTTRMTSYTGQSGGANGYGGLPGWSIEVDTWFNAEFPEPTEEDHVAFVLDGASKTLGELNAPLPDMEDGKWHTMAVDVQGKNVKVSIDGTTYLDGEVDGLTSFPAHVGFTAATGNITNNHFIDALEVERFVCDD